MKLSTVRREPVPMAQTSRRRRSRVKTSRGFCTKCASSSNSRCVSFTAAPSRVTSRVVRSTVMSEKRRGSPRAAGGGVLDGAAGGGVFDGGGGVFHGDDGGGVFDGGGAIGAC